MKVKTYIELEVEVEADYTPRRPAPMVQDHDDPGYSDPGHDEEIEITAVEFITPDGRAKVPDELIEYIKDMIDGAVCSECRFEYERGHGECSIK